VQRPADPRPIGEKWIVLIARDAANGVSRFDDFRRHIGMSDAVLSDCDAILSHREASGRTAQHRGLAGGATICVRSRQSGPAAVQQPRRSETGSNKANRASTARLNGCP
jgi:hypothetical protein